MSIYFAYAYDPISTECITKCKANTKYSDRNAPSIITQIQALLDAGLDVVIERWENYSCKKTEIITGRNKHKESNND